MRRVVNRVQGRNFKPSKFRQVVNQALSRIAKLKEERQGKYNAHLQAIHLFLPYAPALLNPALRRCGDLIKDQNRLDAYNMIEQYLNLLMERIYLLGHGRDCPAELKEAASGVVFAATRCKEIPELEEIKSILTSRFGKEFIGRAVELHRSSAPNQLLGEKLSAMRPSPDSKMNLLKFIASKKGELPLPNQEQMSGKKRKSSRKPHSEMVENLSEELDDSSNSTHGTKKNKGVALNTSPYQTNFESSYFIHTRQRNKGIVLSTTAPNQASFEPSSSMQTRQKNATRALNSSPRQTRLNPSSPPQSSQKNKGVALNTSPHRTNFNPFSSMHTRQKNKGVALNSKRTDVNSFNYMQTIERNKVVPLNPTSSRTSFDPSNSTQTRQKKNKGVSTNPYRTRSSSHKQ